MSKPSRPTHLIICLTLLMAVLLLVTSLAHGNAVRCESVFENGLQSERFRYLDTAFKTYLQRRSSPGEGDLEGFLHHLLDDRVDHEIQQRSATLSFSERIELRGEVLKDLLRIVEDKIDRVISVPLTNADLVDLRSELGREPTRSELEQLSRFYSVFALPLPPHRVLEAFETLGASIPIFLMMHTILHDYPVSDYDFVAFFTQLMNPNVVDEIRFLMTTNRDGMHMIRQASRELNLAIERGELEIQDRVAQEKDFEEAFDIIVWRSEQINNSLNDLYFEFQSLPVTPENLRATQYLEVMMKLQDEMRMRQNIFMALTRFRYFF